MTHKVINEHNEWCNQNIPFSIKPVEDYLTQGITYMYKRDRGHRPILIINVERLIAAGADVDTMIYLANFQIDFVIRNCLIPGIIENWTVIVDLSNVGLTQIPKTLLQGMISAMAKNYRGRMYKLFCVQVAWLVRSLWKIVQSLIDEFTASKISIHGSNDFQEPIKQIIDEKNLE